MKYFEIGQTVYHQGLGEGKVKHYYSQGVCPVIVEFNRLVVCTFTEDGKMFIDGPITLSQNPIPPIVNTPINEFKQGELVWCKVQYGGNWEARFYSHIDISDNQNYVFVNQKKQGGRIECNEVRKFEDNPLI